MKYQKIPQHTIIQPGAMPQFFQGSSKAVLLLHGFTGYPGDMKYLGQRLNDAGYTVSIPRLPGHGTNSSDFLQTRWHDWLRKAIDAYLELKNQYEHLYVAGLSMGGLLTLLLASQFKIEKIALAAPAITNYNRKTMVLTPLLRYFVKKTEAVHDKEETDPTRKVLAEEYWKQNYIFPISDLFHLQRLTKTQLPYVKADTYIIVSKNDKSVPIKAADIIENRISSTTVEKSILEKSGHVLVNGIERDIVADKIIDWFQK